MSCLVWPITRGSLLLAAVVLTGGLARAAPAGPLAVNPTEALHKLAQLDGRKPALTEAEDRLFQDARTGKFDRCSFSEACLIAGGIADPLDRKKYLDRLDAIETDARKAAAGSNSVAEDGARLLKFLHAGPMAKGYKEDQSDLHVLLDNGQFNCVSSAVLYTVMGQRLGIDVRAVQVPRHVFSVLVTRDRRIDVETTSARGFDLDPLRRDGPAKADRPKESRREVGPPGLAGMVAYNHGVDLIRQKRYPAAVRANVFALGLDPDNPAAAKNLAAALGRWSADLAGAGKYDKAMSVASVGRELVPTEGKFHRLIVDLCDDWAREYIDREDWTRAAEIYQRGVREFPDDKQLANKLLFCRLRMP
jgi:tetratricopeptide (TPR) repeat protein